MAAERSDARHARACRHRRRRVDRDRRGPSMLAPAGGRCSVGPGGADGCGRCTYMYICLQPMRSVVCMAISLQGLTSIIHMHHRHRSTQDGMTACALATGHNKYGHKLGRVTPHACRSETTLASAPPQ